MYKAFQGANGWYVAFERRDGTHKQPSLGQWFSEAEAKAKARYANDECARLRRLRKSGRPKGLI